MYTSVLLTMKRPSTRDNELLDVFKQIGVDRKDLRLIKNIYEMQRAALQLGGEVRQGCVDIKRRSETGVCNVTSSIQHIC